jgi:citrate lyase subunit beta/citryl-CoA lyase
MLRSMLFVPADSERKLAKADTAGADALIIDLEDSVPPQRRFAAREMARDYLQNRRGAAAAWVRVNDLAGGELLKDLAATVPARPAGILLPKIRGPEDIQTVANYLEALETAYGLESGGIALLALVTETPAAVLRMSELLRVPCPRLKALSWGAEDLSSSLGAGDPRLAGGDWRPLYAHARSQCILAAHALGIAAIDTVYVNYRDAEGLRVACAASRHDGFGGRLAIHPDQVAVINEAFAPTGEELALARRIVAAFAGGSGVVAIDGKMYDMPHLKAAQRLLSP